LNLIRDSTSLFGVVHDVHVDCLKITEDKSSDNRVHASDVRLIKATCAMTRCMAQSLCPSIPPMPRCKARSPRLNTTVMPRRRAQNPHLSTTSVLRHTAYSPRLKREARGTRLIPCQRRNIELEARISTPPRCPKHEAQDPRPALPQRLNAELKLVFQLERNPASQL